MKGNRIYSEKKTFNRVSFRKSSVGLIAVIVGSVVFMVNGRSVKADEIQNPSSTQTQVIQTQSSTPQVKKPVIAPTTQQTNKSSINSTAEATAKNISVNVTGNKSETISGQDIIDVDISVNDLNNHDKNVKIGFSNVGNDNSQFIIAANNLPKVDENSKNSDFTKLDDNWGIGLTNPGEILARWINENEIPSSLNISIPLEGNQKVIKNDNDGKNSNVNLYIDGKQFGNQPLFSTNLVPYKDEVESDEILKGFSMGEKSSESELNYHNISADEANEFNIIQQWGIYFNYAHASGTTPHVPATLLQMLLMMTGNGKTNNNILNPLQDADFKVILNGQQVFLPDSIRVYQVPDNMIVKDGVRIGIDDIDPVTGIKYYNEICTDKNRNKDFENFLRQHLENNGIHVNENGQGDFYITDSQGNKNTDVATHAYFIQIDGGIEPNNSNPTKGLPSMTYATVVGKGDTHTETVNELGEITGVGTGIVPGKPTNPTTPTTPSNPTKPTTPTNPTTPKQPSTPNIPDGTPSIPLNPITPHKPGTVPSEKGYIEHKKHQKMSTNNERKKENAIKKVYTKSKENVHTHENILPTTGETHNKFTMAGLIISLLELISILFLKKEKRNN